MKRLYPISMLLLLAPRGFSQALPTATNNTMPTPATQVGPRLSWVDGTVHYALTASEIFQYGYYGSGRVTSSTAFSGNVGYSTLNETHPFTMLGTAGLVIGQNGQGTRTYFNTALSQSLIKGRWVLGVNDTFTFLPQGPTTGFSGIAGVGVITPIPVDGPADGVAGGVLTYTGNRIGNNLGGYVERMMTGKTSVSGGVNWMVLHFLDEHAGIDSGSFGANVGLNHRLDIRNSITVSGVYSRFKTTGLYNNIPGYPVNQLTYYTKGVNLSYMRQWTRSLQTNVSAGPQWVSSSSPLLVPDRLNAFVNANLGYTRRVGHFSLRYTRGVNNGSGVFAGAMAQSFSGGFSRDIARNWSASAVVAFTRTSGIFFNTATPTGTNSVISTTWGTIQVMHGFSRTISAHASYSAQNQDGTSAIASQNIYRGLSHTFGFGVSWTPQSKRFGDF